MLPDSFHREALVVLGAAVWPGGEPSPTLRRRIVQAMHIWHIDPGFVVVGTGGQGRHGPSEAEVICSLLEELDIPPEFLFREDRSTTTLENFAYTRRILDPLGINRIHVITDTWHMKRALMTARAFGFDAVPCAVEWPKDTPVRRRAVLRLREALARPAYRWKLRKAMVRPR